MPLRFLTAGESHGPLLTVIVDGLPAGLDVDAAGIDRDLRRRQGGYGRGGRMKIEHDQARLTGGVRHRLRLKRDDNPVGAEQFDELHRSTCVPL